MLQLATLRNNTELVKERLAIKNFKEINLVDEIISLDDERKKFTFQFDETKAKINAASKEIGMLMAKGKRKKPKQKRKKWKALKTISIPFKKNWTKLKNN